MMVSICDLTLGNIKMWLSAIKLAVNAGSHIYKKKQETKMRMADAQAAHAENAHRFTTGAAVARRGCAGHTRAGGRAVRARACAAAEPRHRERDASLPSGPADGEDG